MEDIYVHCDNQLPKLTQAMTLIENGDYMNCKSLITSINDTLQKAIPTNIPRVYLNKFGYKNWDNEILKEIAETLERIEFFLVKHQVIPKDIVVAYISGAIDVLSNGYKKEVHPEEETIIIIKGLLYAYCA